jgi:recombination DNA repair RAD52 pathway protein
VNEFQGMPPGWLDRNDLALGWQQLEQLFRPLNPDRIKTRDRQAYIEAWDVIAHLSRIFGPFNWNKEVRDVELLYDTPVEWERNGIVKSGFDVAYRATVRLTVNSPLGYKVSEDAATGQAQHQPSRGDAHDLALKTAVSDALKRAAKDLGNQFGLSLYHEGSAESVLSFSLAHPNPFEES